MSQHSTRGHAWERLAAAVKREEHECHLCGGLIDKTLPRYHPASFAVDHILPASKYPELRMVRSNLRAAHRRCNLRRGNRLHAAITKVNLHVSDW